MSLPSAKKLLLGSFGGRARVLSGSFEQGLDGFTVTDAAQRVSGFARTGAIAVQSRAGQYSIIYGMTDRQVGGLRVRASIYAALRQGDGAGTGRTAQVEFSVSDGDYGNGRAISFAEGTGFNFLQGEVIVPRRSSLRIRFLVGRDVYLDDWRIEVSRP